MTETITRGTCFALGRQGYGAVEAVLAADYDRLQRECDRLREALTELLGCPANVVQATVPRSGIESAPPYQVVLDVSVSLTRWKKAKAALDAQS